MQLGKNKLVLKQDFNLKQSLAYRIHIVEPMSAYTTITKAKLRLAVQTTPKLYQQEPFIHKTPNELPKDYLTRFQTEPANSPARGNPLYLGPVINLPLVMKQEVVKQQFKWRPLYVEVGLVLDDICEAVAQGKPYGREDNAITNRVIEDRIKQKEREVKEFQESERRRKTRRENLHEKIKVLSQKKEEQDKKKAEDMQKPHAPSKKEKELKRYHEEQRGLIKDHKEKKDTEKEALLEKEKEKKWKEREIKKRRFKDFNSKKIGELVSLICIF